MRTHDYPGSPRLAESLKAIVQPAPLAKEPHAYVGRFGERVISVEGGALFYQPDGRPAARLLSLDPDLFVSETDPSVRIRVRRQGGRAAAIELLRDDGAVSTFERSGDT